MLELAICNEQLLKQNKIYHNDKVLTFITNEQLDTK
jgi:hypothetical protein